MHIGETQPVVTQAEARVGSHKSKNTRATRSRRRWEGPSLRAFGDSAALVTPVPSLGSRTVRIDLDGLELFSLGLWLQQAWETNTVPKPALSGRGIHQRDPG